MKDTYVSKKSMQCNVVKIKTKTASFTDDRSVRDLPIRTDWKILLS